MQTQSFKIKSKPFEATELANNIKVASYTAKNQNSKNK